MIDQQTVEMLLVGVWDTLYMTLVATFFSYVFGLVMGVVLVICRKDGVIVEQGSPDVLFTNPERQEPRDFLARFMAR